ncbi:myosin-like protein [Achlya hypogyna]|uniref:Myosin-like protein n=1 Tax=Achlya hypogyna TaxID=1202772 RepID=A0A1V9Y5V6_ACHHY|nr:myosin-like protein [Achlya hypogyna]
MTVSDLILLPEVSEAAVVKELSIRYRANEVYTYIGPVLIAVNPYKTLKKDGLSLYDEHWIDEFSGREMHENDPHPFAIAESAYSHLMRFQTNQCLLITGESGSGKTETSKHVLQYIANISTKARTRQAVNQARTLTDVKKQEIDEVVNKVRRILIRASPVLEAFGNAQTIRNNNSSRFGKYMLLQMNVAGQVVGGFIHNYLLEKNRVIMQAAGERNFHCFYHLLAGASAADRSAWNLKDASHFKLLQNENRTIDDVDDRVEYQNMAHHMTAVGISDEEQRSIYQQIAAILHLGNVSFLSLVDDSHNPCCKIDPATRESLDVAAKLLGVTPESLDEMFTFKSLVINRQETLIPLTASQGTKVLHSLAKVLYENIFTWLVQRVNKGIHTARGSSHTMGILDIYGFEIFQENAFEQLCINYVNEKLQQLFISQTLQSEQQEYQREGVAWVHIEYFNNQVVCDLIEDAKMPGIMPLLDEQCAISQTTVDVLMHRFNETYDKKHPHYTKSRVKGSTFQVRHYAGTVEYDVTNFAEANIDSFFTELYANLAKSTNAYVRNLLTDDRSTKEKLKRPPSTSFQFRGQVATLLAELQRCNPHYVRCIKPNDKKVSGMISSELVAAQVRCLGLIENIRVRRAGFCYRETYATFLHRYKILSTTSWPAPKNCSSRQATLELLTAPDMGVLPSLQPQSVLKANGGKDAAMPVHADGKPLTPLEVYRMHLAMKNGSKAVDKAIEKKIIPFQEDADSMGCFSLGRNKVFIKHPAALFSLERLRQDKLPEIARIIEAAWVRRLLRIRLAKYQVVYDDLMRRLDAVKRNIADRGMRRAGANNKVTIAALYGRWTSLADAVLPARTRFHAQLEAAELHNKVAFAQSFVRRNAAVANLRKLKAAVAVFSSRWKGRQTRKNMPYEQWQRCYQVMLGIRTEFERLFGKKKRRRDTLDRVYLGDYINCSKYPALRALITDARQRQILFAGETLKVNEKTVAQSRLLLIGETYMHNVKAEKIDKPKERRRVQIAALKSLSMSSLQDNYLFVHVEGEVDLMYEVDQKTEIVMLLRKRFKELRKKELPVMISDEIEFEAKKNQRNLVKFVKAPTVATTTLEKVDKKHVIVRVGTLQQRRY